MKLLSRFFSPPKQSFFLFGPRGTGKSTWMREIYKDALWIDLLRPDVLRSYLAYPERLVTIIDGNPKVKIIVIDEIQKAPELLSVVHLLIAQHKDLQFILTGSSARKIKRMNADLLGGRAVKRLLQPFMASELGELFSLQNALLHGLLPVLLSAPNPDDALKAYIALYIHEEIQAEGLVRNLGNFTRFLETISFSHGSISNISNIARECAVQRKTVEGYIAILEELLLVFHLPVFTKKAKRELSAHAKFYFFDTGVFRELRPKGILDKTEEIDGLALEGLVAQHLMAWTEYTSEKHSLSFWRTRSGVEVDFIVYGQLGFWAIEVKNTSCIRSQDLKSLESFQEDYPEVKAICLYRGEEILKQKNVLCIPVEIFLKQLIPNQDLLTSYESVI
jgi:predicted AAA+ superfamily ATPase